MNKLLSFICKVVVISSIFSISSLHYFSSRSHGSKTEDKFNEDTNEYNGCFDCTDDILIEILSRVPADRLLVLKRVCPRWRVLISSYIFMKSNLKNAKHEVTNKPGMFVEYTQYTSNYEGSRQAFLYGDRSNETFRNLEGIRKQCCDIVGSCDGLFMFRVQPERRSLIINPITLESRIITNPNENGKMCCIFFDRFEDDYKILHSYRSGNNILPQDNIFSFNTGLWTKIESIQTHQFFKPRFNDPLVIVCDALHWTGKAYYRCSMMVLAFKIETKEFFYMPYPSAINTKLYKETNCCLPPYDVHVGNGESIGLFEKGGLLCLYHTNIHSKFIDIWFLQCYGDWGSWARMFQVELSILGMYGISNFHCEHTRCMKSIKILKRFNDGDDILISWPCRGLFLYNLKTTQIDVIEDLKLRDTSMGSRGPHRCIPLIKTLVSPNNAYTTL